MEHIEKIVDELDGELKNLIQTQECSICHDIFNSPVTTKCKHSFCNVCIRRSLSDKNSMKCPLCKKFISRRDLSINHVRDFISQKIKHLTSSFVEDVKELELKYKTVRVSSLKVGSYLPSTLADDVDAVKCVNRTDDLQKNIETEIESDVDNISVVPKVKRDKNIIQYSSLDRKKKNMKNMQEDEDKLLSVSQIDENICFSKSPSTDPVKLLKNETVEKKVDEWIEKAGENLYRQNLTDKSNIPTPVYTKVRIDYKKQNKDLKCEQSSDNVNVDPYEFVPSQRARTTTKSRRSRTRASVGKKSEEITASQKFEILVTETVNKRENRKSVKHKLFNSFEDNTFGLSESFQDENSGKKETADENDMSGFDFENVLFEDNLPTVSVPPRRSSRRSSLVNKKPRLETERKTNENHQEVNTCKSVSVSLEKLKQSDVDQQLSSVVVDNHLETQIEEVESQSDVASKNDSLVRSPGWSRVSSLQREFSEEKKKKKRPCMKVLNVSCGEVNIPIPKDSDMADVTKTSDSVVGKENVVGDRSGEKIKSVNKSFTFTLQEKLEKCKSPSDSILVLKLGARNRKTRLGRVKIFFPKNFLCCSCNKLKTNSKTFVGKKKRKIVRSVSVQTCIDTREASTSPMLTTADVCTQTETSDCAVVPSQPVVQTVRRNLEIQVPDDLDSQLRNEILSTWQTDNQSKKCYKRVRQITSDDDDDDDENDNKRNCKSVVDQDQQLYQVVDVNVENVLVNSQCSDCDIFEETPPPPAQTTDLSQWASMSNSEFHKRDTEPSEILSTPVIDRKLLSLDFPSRTTFFNKKPDSPFLVPGEKEISLLKSPSMRGKNRDMSAFCMSTSRTTMDSNQIQEFVNKYKIKFSVSGRDITHLIVGLHKNEESELLPLCTPKLLTAIAYKKWILNENWITDSLKHGYVLPEAKYECKDPSGGDGCTRSRLSPTLLFNDFEFYLHGNFDDVFSLDNFKFHDLITQCGGTVVHSLAQFTGKKMKMILVPADTDDGPVSGKKEDYNLLFEKYKAVVVSHSYIIQSIEGYCLESFNEYTECLVTEAELDKLGYDKKLYEKGDEESQLRI